MTAAQRKQLSGWLAPTSRTWTTGTHGSGCPQHIHVVVRTPNGNDYGKDLLRQHYEQYPHGGVAGG